MPTSRMAHFHELLVPGIEYLMPGIDPLEICAVRRAMSNGRQAKDGLEEAEPAPTSGLKGCCQTAAKRQAFFPQYRGVAEHALSRARRCWVRHNQ
jgi:hypothetical protein